MPRKMKVITNTSDGAIVITQHESIEAVVSPANACALESWINERDKSNLRLVAAGEFTMGSTEKQIETARQMDIGGQEFLLLDELPQFLAFLPDFYLSEYAVTNAQFAEFLTSEMPSAERLKLWAPSLERIIVPAGNEDIYRVVAGFEKHPAIHISWHGAGAYCQWAGLRLPTELEWEKAARGTDGRIFPWGNEWCNSHLRWNNTALNGETTAPVDAYPQGRSPYGIFQMAGNVDEWCADSFQWDAYRRYASGDLRLPSKDVANVVRGGTCAGWQKIRFRCAHRRGNDPSMVNIHFTGIRCACDGPKPPSR